MRTACGVLLALLISGCSGLTQIQDTISRFDQGTHSVATGEMAYFRAVQTADCENQFYRQAYNFSQHLGDTVNLSGTCTPTILDDNQITVRQALVDSITSYVDKIQALATSDDNKQLDANSEDLANKTNALAKQHPFSGLSFVTNDQIAQDVEAAIIGLTEMALDQRRFSDIREAAKAMDPKLTIIVKALENENTNFAQGIASKVSAIQPELRNAILDARRQRKATSILDVIAARDIVRSVDPFGAEPVAQTTGSASANQDPGYIASQLNKGLESMLAANSALANAGVGGVSAAVNDLIARGQHVNAILSSLNK